MMWMLPVGMAAASVFQQDQQNKQIKANNDADAMKTRMSPWTGQSGKGNQMTGSTIGAGIGGAASGLGAMQGLGGLGGAKASAPIAEKSLEDSAFASNALTPGSELSVMGSGQAAPQHGLGVKPFMGNSPWLPQQGPLLARGY